MDIKCPILHRTVQLCQEIRYNSSVINGSYLMRVYVIVSSAALLLLGVVGFAFADQFQIPAYVLIINLILGVWGLYELFKK